MSYWPLGVIIWSVIVILTSSDVIAQDCKAGLDNELGREETYITKSELIGLNRTFGSYYCPSIEEIKLAKELADKFIYSEKIQGGKENSLDDLKVIDKYLNDWFIQYIAFKNNEGQRIIFVHFIKNVSGNKLLIEEWRTAYSWLSSSSPDSPLYSIYVNLDLKKVYQ